MSRVSRTVRPGEGNWGNIIIILIVVVIGISIGGFFLIRYLYRSAVLSPYQSSLKDYTALRPAGGGAPSEQMCKGAIIPIDATANGFDDIYFDLPDNLKPSDPASVKTVVFLNWSKDQIDQYKNGKPAYQHKCMVEIVDRDSKALLKRMSFAGTEPPMSISSRSSYGEGSRPTEQIVAFLKQSSAK